MATIHSFTFEAIGTSWTIDIEQDITEVKLDDIKQKINERIATFDKVYSRFRDDSLVSEIANDAGSYTFPEEDKDLFALYEQLYEVSDGKVTPLVGSLLVEAGYDANYSFTPADNFQKVAHWREAMSYEHPVLTTRKPVLLDFGAAGKGYLVDLVGAVLTKRGIHSYLIDAGGDMLRRSNLTDITRVGLEHPNDPNMAIGVVELGNGSICGSAGNRRKWKNLHHIMNPDTLEPVHDIIATWAIADTALLADGIATALFFTDPAKLKDVFDFEYCLVRSDLSYDYSKNLRAELFTGTTV